MNNVIQFLNTTYTIVLPIFMAYLFNVYRQHNKHKDITDDATKLMLRLFLMELHDSCIRKGFATNEEYQTYAEIWDLYHEGYKGNMLSERHMQDMESIRIHVD